MKSSPIGTRGQFADGMAIVAIAAVGVLSLSHYVLALGLMSDDWEFLSKMYLAEDQSFAGVARAMFARDDVFRPVQWLSLAVMYKLFGLAPTGYHIINAVLVAAAPALFYLALRRLDQPRVFAMATALLFALAAGHATDRFWIATIQANVAACGFFLSLLCDIAAARCVGGRAWSWKALALVFLAVSLLAYEVFISLFLLNAALIFWLHRRRTAMRRLLVMCGLTGAAVLAILAVKTSLAPRAIEVTIDADFLVWYPRWVIEAIWQAIGVTYGHLVLRSPLLVARSLADYARWPDIVVAALVALSGFAMLAAIDRRTRDIASAGSPRMIAYVAAGLIAFAAGYSFFPLDQSISGISNRASIAASAGAALSLVGAIGLIVRAAPAAWRRAAFCGLIVFLCVSGSLTISAVARFWIESHARQTALLDDIQAHFPNLPRGATVVLDGICPFHGPAIVFESDWDLSSALAIRYRDPRIRATTVTPDLEVLPEGLSVEIGPPPTVFVYPYHDAFFVYHAVRRQSFRIADFAAAKAYFRDVSTDVATRCPPVRAGHGVEIF